MAVVTLVSGGLDSILMALLTKESGMSQYPLFIDYGQICNEREYSACCKVLKQLNLPVPQRVDISGFGSVIRTGLTDRSQDVNANAFVPCRNLLFLVIGASYAYQVGAEAVAIGLLSEANRIFPDQTQSFVHQTEALVESILYRRIQLLAPLIEFTKAEVIALAREKGIKDTYSCHSGDEERCGMCISCLEFESSEKEN